MIYGAKSITRFDRLKNADGHPVFEERVVMLNANGQNEAIELAESDAEDYAAQHKGSYLGWVAVYQAKETKANFEGVQEIYSIMRHDDSSDEDYLDHFHDTGAEKTTSYKQ